MPPDEHYVGEGQQLPPPATKSLMPESIVPPTGWIRNTDLARASGAGLSTLDRHKVLRELSQVRVLPWLRRQCNMVQDYMQLLNVALSPFLVGRGAESNMYLRCTYMHNLSPVEHARITNGNNPPR